ncbi:single-stranded DNA-binding protein [bacterium]|nr:single-stranded DNA-binding protein [bacterium]
MSTFNKVLLMGFLGNDPELKTTKNGKSFCRISLATHDRQRTADGEQEEKTIWHSIHVFGRQAEWLCEKMGKGARLFVEAALEKNVKDGEDGKKESLHFLRARQITGLPKAPAVAGMFG